MVLQGIWHCRVYGIAGYIELQGILHCRVHGIEGWNLCGSPQDWAPEHGEYSKYSISEWTALQGILHCRENGNAVYMAMQGIWLVGWLKTTHLWGISKISTKRLFLRQVQKTIVCVYEMLFVITKRLYNNRSSPLFIQLNALLKVKVVKKTKHTVQIYLF